MLEAMRFARVSTLLLILSLAGVASGCDQQSSSSGGAGAGDAGDAGRDDGSALYQPCAENNPCPAGYYCSFRESENCGGPSAEGYCSGIEDTCTDAPTPSCGCDGEVYPSDCAAHQAHVDVGEACEDKVPANLIPCGDKFCDPSSTYCYACGDDTSPAFYYYCWPLPTDCDGGTVCDCLGGNYCQTVEGNGVSGFVYTTACQ